ncbi:MAG: porin [Planctomycetaceae bacterium]|nr:porin [Planctomycetaceae bacterium]
MFLKNLFKKQWLLGCVAAAGMLTAGTGQASAIELDLFETMSVDSVFGSGCGDACGDMCGDSCSATGCGNGCSLLGGGDSGIDVGGWVQYGYQSDSSSRFDLNFNDKQVAGSDQRQGLNQAWLYVEKAADGSCGTDFGFRVDMMYGLDADDTVAFGASESFDNRDNWNHGLYGFAIPQLYGEVANGDWNVKFGHFYTLVGYEVVTAPDNFFYSHAYTMFNNEPFTHSGALVTYTASDNVELYGGWTAGWDTGFDQYDDGSNFLGGASVGLGDNVTATYITTLGDLGWRGEGYSHSLVLDVVLTDDLNYVFQTDLVDTNSGGDHQLAINQYLFYTISDKLAAGLRAEWWKSGSSPVGDGSQSIYEVTAGVNIKPLVSTDSCGNTTGDWLIVRPEVRHDWSGGGDLNSGDPQINYTTFGSDVIITF